MNEELLSANKALLLQQQDIMKLTEENRRIERDLNREREERQADNRDMQRKVNQISSEMSSLKRKVNNTQFNDFEIYSNHSAFRSQAPPRR